MRSVKAKNDLKYHDTTGDVNVTYVIVGASVDPGYPDTREDPGLPPSADFERVYIEGDVDCVDIFQEFELFDPGIAPWYEKPEMNELFDRICEFVMDAIEKQLYDDMPHNSVEGLAFDAE